MDTVFRCQDPVRRFQILRVERTAIIAYSAADTWRALHLEPPCYKLPASRFTRHKRSAPDIVQLWLKQQVRRSDAVRMTLHQEIPAGWYLPWASCESCVRVVPLNPITCRVQITCVVNTASKPAVVQSILRGLMLISLHNLRHALRTRDKADDPQENASCLAI